MSDKAGMIDLLAEGPMVGQYKVLRVDDGEQHWMLLRDGETVDELLRAHEIDPVDCDVRPWTTHEYLHKTCRVDGEPQGFRLPLRVAAATHARDLDEHRAIDPCFASTCV